jgi:hypothetical protein
LQTLAVGTPALDRGPMHDVAKAAHEGLTFPVVHAWVPVDREKARDLRNPIPIPNDVREHVS